MRRSMAFRAGLLPALVAAALWLLAAPAGAGAAPRPRVDSLVVLHTNDIHSHLFPFDRADGARVGGAAARAALIERERRRAPDLLLLDAGDLVQGAPVYSLFRGRPETHVQTELRYDAAALGNHDLDDGPRAWLTRQRSADYPTLSANVFAAAESAWAATLTPASGDARAIAARWIGGAKVAPGASLRYLATPYVRRTWHGVRVIVFGLTTGSLDRIVRPGPNGGVAVADPVAVARRLVPSLRANADVLIALTHIGVDEDRRLADLVPGIDLIVGGHSHTRLFRPIRAGQGAGPWSGGTTIVQAGSWGEYVGRAVIALADGRPNAISDRLLP
ncbi:MAG TPA: metallophosphoesterase, partial [Candidatus Eisenbacteria bacterium]